MKKHETMWFEAGWFPYSYAFCPSRKAWDFTMSKFGRRGTAWQYPDGNAGTTSLFQRRDTKSPCAIVTVLDRTPQQTVELLAHEAMHVWRDIRKTMGESKPSSELEAYAMQNILSNLMTAYRQTRGPLFTHPLP